MANVDYKFFLEKMEKTQKGSSSKVTRDSTLASLPIDSLDMFAIIGDFEDATDKTLSDEEFETMETVEDFLLYFS